MKAKVELARKIVRFFYQILFSLLFMEFVHVVVLKKEIQLSVVCALAFLYIFSYVIRELSWPYVVILLSYIALGTILYFSSFSFERKMLLVALCIHHMFVVLSYVMKGSKVSPVEDIPWPTVVFGVVGYLYGKVMGSVVLENMSYIIPLLMLVLHYVMIYTDGLLEYVKSTKDVSGLPLKRMISTNNVFVTIILFVAIIAVVIGRFIDFGELLGGIWDAIVYVVRYFAFGIGFIARFIVALLSGNENASLKTEEETNLTGKEGFEGNAIFTGELFFKILFVCIVTFFLVKIIKGIVKKLSMARIYEKDVVERIQASGKEKTRKSIKKGSLFDFSSEKKIRKYYKLRILRNRYDIKLSEYKTAEEIKDELIDINIDDVTEITDLYSLVRYGDCVPDKGMVKRAGRLSKE